MKKTLIISAALITIVFSACKNSEKKVESTKPEATAQVFNLDTTKLKTGDTFFQCEMNPEVLSDKAGNCPTCGMELTELKKH